MTNKGFDMLRNVKIRNILFTAVSAAVLSACGGGGGSSPNTQLVNNATSARSVIDRIAALPDAESVTVSDVAAVNQAIAAYNSLGSSQSFVGRESADKLKALEAAIKTADAAATQLEKQIASLPATSAEIDTVAEESQLAAAADAYAALTDVQKTWVDSAAVAKLENLSKDIIVDNDPLTPLNLATPLHTSFISSASAQQNNPNVQLRQINGKKAFTYDQGGLISTLAFNKNDEVKLDGVVITNNTTSGGATEVNFTTPGSMIAKAYSGGISKEDVSEQKGEKPNTTFEVGKSTFDSTIVELYNDLEETRSEYDSYRRLRQNMSNDVSSTAANIAYIQKDKNGLVFDKKFDGVYIVKFTDGTQIVLHDSAAAGWTYQTFAHYTDPKNGVLHGYQSLGDETSYAALPSSGTATYNGLTTAYLVQNGTQKQVTADVKAVVDFAKKGVRFETSNTHFRAVDANGYRVDTKAAAYDIKANAKWSNSNQFAGTATTANGMSGDLNGKFYGANAAEIGGTYGLKNAADTEQLIGGYGAKRQ